MRAPGGSAEGTATQGLDGMLERGRPNGSLDEQIALRSLEAALFDRPARPLTVARYVLVERLGQGSRGLVYRAYDPELDRRVAVKLVQARADRDGAGSERLLAEAQALARLSHPNVVSVYDVGTYSELDLSAADHAVAPEIPERGVFIVMEFVEGANLAAWMRTGSRRWREVIDVFRAAGRGLAAAHARELVHRDFKPANVALGDDGRVRVLDFGLALAADRGRAGRRREIAGTLAYMAPEQHRGEPADARSDQYAFAVSLYHALVGELPFAGRGVALVTEKHAGPGRALDGSIRNRVPRHVRAALARALAVDPAERHASMDALLDDLASDPVRRRRRWVAGIGAVAVACAGVAAMAQTGWGVDPCASADARMEASWSPRRRADISRSMEALELPFASGEWSRVQRDLERYAAEWSRSRISACESTQLRAEQSADLLDRRVACLDRRWRAFERIVASLERVDVEHLEHARADVAALPRVADCEDIDALLRGIEPPATEGARRAVDDIYAQLGRVRSSLDAAHFAEADALGHELVARADRLGYAPAIADTSIALAEVKEARGEFEAAEAHLLTAVLAAERSRDDVAAADAWTHLVWVVGVERKDLEGAETWARFAQAAVDRLGGDQLREAQLAHNLGGLRYSQGRHGEALATYQLALDLQRAQLGEGHPTVARTLNHMGNTLIMMGEYERAYQLCEQAGALRSEALGAGHPLVAATLNNRAIIRIEQGRPDDVGPLVAQARTIVEGTGTPEELITMTIVGDFEFARDHLEQAREGFVRAEALAIEIHGRDDYRVVSIQTNLDMIEQALAARGTSSLATRDGQGATPRD